MEGSEDLKKFYIITGIILFLLVSLSSISMIYNNTKASAIFMLLGFIDCVVVEWHKDKVNN